jgi:SAM-dependent methyltransferase
LLPLLEPDALIMSVFDADDDDSSDDGEGEDTEEAMRAQRRKRPTQDERAAAMAVAADEQALGRCAGAAAHTAELAAKADVPGGAAALAVIASLQRQLAEAQRMLQGIVAASATAARVGPAAAVESCRRDCEGSLGSSAFDENGKESTPGRKAGGADQGADKGADKAKASAAGTATKAAEANASAAGLTPGTTSKSLVGRQDNDSYYYDSYASVGIHNDMLKDRVRTESYRDAILLNAGGWIKGKRVLDIGCGTGILSMFAAKAGAAKVVSLDASGIIEDARAIVQANGKADVITLVRGKAEETDLSAHLRDADGGAADDDGKADVLISEWMGYALLYECMLNSVLYVRDRFLRPGGRMLPSHASIHVAAFSDPRFWADRVGFWSDVYGFNMRTMARHVFAEPYVEVLRPESIASSECILRCFDLAAMRPEEQDVVDARWSVTVGGAPSSGDRLTVHGVALWFDIGFHDSPFSGVPVSGSEAALGLPSSEAGSSGGRVDLPGAMPTPPAPAATAPYAPVAFSTSAKTTPTHWQQTLLLLEQPLENVPCGTVLGGRLSMTRDATNPREYRFLLELESPGPAFGQGIVRRQAYHMR